MLIPLLSFFLLAGCDQINQQLGVEDPVKKEARIEAEGKAVGSACRQSGRAIEDCYAIYGWLAKADIFSGWREMDAYMRENQIETVVPLLPPPEPPGAKKRKKTSVAEGTAEGADNSAEKASEKSAAKPAEKRAEKPPEKAADKVGEKISEKPGPSGGEKAAEKVPDKDSEQAPAKITLPEKPAPKK